MIQRKQKKDNKYMIRILKQRKLNLIIIRQGCSSFLFTLNEIQANELKKREYYSSSLTQVLLLCLICFVFVVVVVVVMSYFLAAVTFNKFLMTVNERGKLVN